MNDTKSGARSVSDNTATTINTKEILSALRLQGELDLDFTHDVIYSTDASVYDERPLGVCYPADEADIVDIVKTCAAHGIPIIPRATGTSLAGQVVGRGFVCDISRHMNRILEINEKERWVRVQPGVVLDELNIALRPHGLFFGPETSTANRCCVGGMAGNNSCGSHSLVYGNTRDHLLEARVVLSDGSVATFGPASADDIARKGAEPTTEGRIYRSLAAMFADRETRAEIVKAFPDPSLKRRNSGYALDELAVSRAFDPDSSRDFNICRLLAGSEGTLAFTTELKLTLDPLPPEHRMLICVHCRTLWEAFDANLVALEAKPDAVELIDDHILQLSKDNIAQRKNRFFVQGDPAALLVIEISADSEEDLVEKADHIESELRARKLGYAYPRIEKAKMNAVWNLRKAGLGLLNGVPGSKKPVAVIEDTAIPPKHLKAFHQELQKELKGLGLDSVYYAHIGSGELHLRPILDLKRPEDRELFHTVALNTAKLVKKYGGSLSGEHGDGRLRGEFLPLMYGERVFGMMREVKGIFDPQNIFNPGKIIDTPKMNEDLRQRPSLIDGVKTYFDFSDRKGWMCAIEQCNGSGDCRKAPVFGGVMCPSFRATRHETHSTRARANIMRELLLQPAHKKIFSQPEILALLSTCLSCKGCKAECPSNVDITRLKSEYLQHHYDESGVPFTVWLTSMLPAIQQLGMVAPKIYNATVGSRLVGGLIKKVMGFAPQRSIPLIYRETLKHWMKTHPEPAGAAHPNGRVYLFADEFTNYEDVPVGIDFIELLRALGYEVVIPNHEDSGRILLSKGLLKRAKRLAEKNVEKLSAIVTEETPLVGIEPSCILSFRDEYLTLVPTPLQERARQLGRNALLYDEFIVREIDKGKIKPESFTDARLNILLHGHCHQKSLASVEPSRKMLELPKNYHCDIIPSGCCGMAGEFGYEKANYELSMRVGEEVLFPAVREAAADCAIAAPGTSCRHQIQDGTGRRALHPITLLRRALK